jgi:hypothetical protein
MLGSTNDKGLTMAFEVADRTASAALAQAARRRSP